jgi:hypothetical protein
MTSHKHTLLGIGLAIVVIGTTSLAQAQQYGAPPPYAPPPGYAGYPPPPPAPPPRVGMYRSGLVGGVGLGFGGISAANCGDVCGIAGALELHLGGMLTPRLSIGGDLWFNWHSIANSTASTTHSLYTIAVQYWATDRLWLKGGIGGATMRISDDYDNFTYSGESGLGLMAAGGLELLHAGNFALDGQLRFGHGFYDIDGDVNVWALMLGANWY